MGCSKVQYYFILYHFVIDLVLCFRSSFCYFCYLLSFSRWFKARCDDCVWYIWKLEQLLNSIKVTCFFFYNITCSNMFTDTGKYTTIQKFRVTEKCLFLIGILFFSSKILKLTRNKYSVNVVNEYCRLLMDKWPKRLSQTNPHLW